MFAAPRRAIVATLPVSLVAILGCGPDANPGLSPPNDAFTFPAGLSLDPRVASESMGICSDDLACDAGELCAAGQCREPSRWMFVVNAASDLTYNSGSVMGFDLDAFHTALRNSSNIGHPESKISKEAPCRRISLTPSIVECEESFFVPSDATIHIGLFAGRPQAWDRVAGDGEATLLVPVRGDPSITSIDIRGGLDQDNLTLDCGQGSDSGRRDGRRCGDEFRMLHYRNDDDEPRIEREPFNIVIDPNPTSPLAYVSHLTNADLTLINLAGLDDAAGKPSGRPAIIDQSRVFGDNAIPFDGGYGMAVRPCDPDVNAPKITANCRYPLMYGGFRFAPFIRPTVAIGVSAEEVVHEQRICADPSVVGTYDFSLCEEAEATRGCEENWKLPAFRDACDECRRFSTVCDESILAQGRFFSGGLSTGGSSGTAVLGGMAFSQDGNQLYVVQSNPGALLRIDTSLDEAGDPVNRAAGQEEVCSKPTAFSLYEDANGRYGLVSCYRSAELFVVDLTSLDLVKTIRVGTGPHEILVDMAREYLYIANTLDATISVVDMSRKRPTRFAEVARIGLQEPYTK